MAAKATTNRIVLKVAVVYDQADALKQAKRVQDGIDKQSEQTFKNASRNSKTATDNINKTNNALKTQRSFLDKVTGGWDNVIAKTLKSVFITGTFFKALRQIRVAVEIATELDTAYTNLSIVSKATASEIAQIDVQVDNLTTSLGRMKKEVINSITEFSRAGFTISESMLLAKNAIMGANVGATSLEKVTTFLVAGLKSFKMEAEDSAKILDVLFRVANTTAINLEGIGEAFLRSANTLFTAGASLEQSAALIAAANESIQNPASVGTALKTIASRLRGVGDEGEVIPTLAKDFKAVGIEIQNADGSFRNIYDVFKDFADIYGTLDDLTKESLLEKLAGKRQKNIMIGLLENFDIAEMAFENALTSAGEVALAQEKYVKSLEGRVNVLKETWNQFLMALTNTQALKELVSLFSGLIGGLTWIITSAPILISAIIGIGVAIASALGVLNPFGFAIAVIVGLFFQAQQVMLIFGDQTDKINKKIADTTTAIEKLNKEIKKLEDIDQSSRTDAENALLKTYQAQVEAKKELLKIEEGRLATQELENFKKVEQGIEGLSSAVDLFQTQLSELNGVMEDDMIDTNLELQESFYELELRLLGNIQRAEENLEIFDKNSVAYNVWNTILEKSVAGLDVLKSKASEFGYQLGSLTVEADKSSDAMNKLASATDRAMSTAKKGVKDYQLLSDAIVQVTKNGYLSNDMLDALLVAYPDIIAITGLAAGAMTDYAEVHRMSTAKIIDDQIKLLNTQKTVFAEQIRFYEESMKMLATGLGGNDELMYRAQNMINSGSISSAKTAIRNAENAIALLQNQKNAFSGIKKERETSLKVTPEKEVTLLTEKERAIRDITFAIDAQNKLLERTNAPAEQVVINEKLVGLYSSLKDALSEHKEELKKTGSTLNTSSKEYEDYVANVQKVSLEIETATNNIYKFSQSAMDLKNKISEMTRQDMAKVIRNNTTAIIENAKTEIKLLNKELDKLKELYDERKRNFDIQKEEAEFKKKIEELDNEITQAEIENELLSLDNSIESQRRRAVLGEELVRLNKSKQDAISDYNIRQEERRMDEEYRIAKEGLEAQIKLKQEQIETIEALSAQAIYNIENNLALSAENLGNIMADFINGIGSAWDNAGDNLQDYLNLLAKAVSGSGGANFQAPTSTPTNSSGSTPAMTRDMLIDEMRSNSREWHVASAERRKQLESRNQALGGQLGLTYRSGVWYNPDGSRAYTFDNGGKLEKGEVAVNKEQDNEWVLTDKNLMSIFEKGLGGSGGILGMRSPTLDSENSGKLIENLINIENMNNNLSSDYDVERLGSKLVKGGKNTLSQYGYKF